MPDPQPAWHLEVLPDGWSRAVEALAGRSVLGGFYLAGGTGLALHFGHRRSVDLDLFNEHEFDAANLRARLRNLEDLRVRQVAPGTLHLELLNTLVSFLHYPYPLLFPVHSFAPLAVADPRDIACMKLDTIASRGSRRDFIDLYLAAQSYGLREIMAWFDRKYAATPFNRVHLFKALTYFADAEQQPMPDLLVPIHWPTVTAFFRHEVPRMLALE